MLNLIFQIILLVPSKSQKWTLKLVMITYFSQVGTHSVVKIQIAKNKKVNQENGSDTKLSVAATFAEYEDKKFIFFNKEIKLKN